MTDDSGSAEGATPEMTGAPLIAASKVQGTPVFNMEGERLGHVEDVMIHKLDGRVAVAVMSFGGFLGIGEKYHPLPWSVLTYDPGRGGYVVPLARERLHSAPFYDKDELSGADAGWGRRVSEFYQVTPSWV